MIFRLWVILIAACSVYWAIITNPAYANIQMAGLQGSAIQGRPVSISPKWEAIPVESIRVYYRAMGTRSYQRLDLVFPEDGQLSFDLPSESIVAPGIEFYIEVKTPSGQVMTSPPATPHRNPHSVKVSLPRAPTFQLVHPSPNAIFLPGTPSPTRFEIKAEAPQGWDRRRFAVLFDGVDVTRVSDFTRDTIIYEHRKAPEPGSHKIEVVGRGPSGQRVASDWTIVIPKDKIETQTRGEVYTQGGLSVNYGAPVIEKDSGSVKNQVSGNLNLAFGVESEDFDLSWQGINLQYVKDADDEFTLSSGFLLEASRWGQSLEYGDISIKETQLTAPSFARRGTQAKLDAFNTQVRLFDVQAETVNGFESGLASSNQVYGVSFNRALLPDSGLETTLVYITGENEAGDGFNSSSTESPTQGDVFGATLSHALAGMMLNGEIASSWYDSDTTDIEGKKNGVAGSAGVSTRIQFITLGVGYDYYHPDFASIANPNFTSDRTGYNANIGGALGSSLLSLSLSQSHDNVTDDSTRPVVTSTSGALNYALAIPERPTLNLSYNRSMQDSEKEPAGTTGVKNTNDLLNGSISHNAERWSANFSAALGKLDDKIFGNDSTTRDVTLNGSYNPNEIVNTSGSASLTESDTGGVVTRTWLYSVTSTLPVLSPYGSTSFQVSYSFNTADDNSQDNTNLNGSYRISFNIHEFIKEWIDYGQEVLAFSFNYSKIEDKLDSTNSVDDYSGFITMNFHAPIRGRYAF